MASSINEMPPRSESVWYIIKPTAHEGPYSYEQLLSKLANGVVSKTSLIWARGWPEAVEFHQLQNLFESQITNLNLKEPLEPEQAEFEEFEAHEISELPSDDTKKRSSVQVVLSLTWVVLGLGGGLAFYLVKDKPVLDRPTSVSVSDFRDLKTLFENTQDRVPLPKLIHSLDFKKISLVDRSSQNCSYSINFFSAASQNLSQEKIAFTAQAQSHQHWIVLDRFDFRDGQRLVPGHYEVNLQRTACTPVGWKKLIGKRDDDFALSFRQSFHSGSLQDLEKSLALLANKKVQEEQRLQLASVDAWREINEKLRTLKAISMQIKADFKILGNRGIKWPVRVEEAVRNYTLRVGSFLTGFLENNEADFKRISELDIPMKLEILGRAPLIVGFAKRIGLITSQLIEKIEKKGVTPTRADLDQWLKNFEHDLSLEQSKLDLAKSEVELIIKTESAQLEEAPTL